MTATTPGPAPTRRSSSPRFRIVYREASGRLHLDWPLGELGRAVADAGGCTWVDVDDRGGDLPAVEALLRDVFGFHPLAIEDALRETNVPKLDDWGDYLYTVFHSIDFNPDTDEMVLNELDVFLGKNFLVTYHPEPTPILDRLRQSIERDHGHRLNQGADHLLSLLLDLGVADYMPAIEHLDEAIDAAQDELLADARPSTLRQILRVKQSALKLHRVLIPQREVLNRLARDEYAPVDAQARVYFRDVYDHLVRVHDISETLRDLVSGALDLYMTAMSNRTNEVMKTLTVVTVLFLPLNFVVGFFGMNFFGANIELSDLHLPHDLIFLVILACMGASPWFMWRWAKRRGWF